jgi:hypothetical protein
MGNKYGWVKSCVKKKSLRDCWADNISKKSKISLTKYYCAICDGWHLTKIK